MTRADRPLALTLGDPAGIGPDITLLAFEARFRTPIPPFVLLGDPDVLAERTRALGLGVKIKSIADASAALPVFAIALPVVPISVAAPVVTGRPVPANAGAVAFKRAGDPNVGEFSDAVVLKKFGDVPNDLS